MTRSSSVIRIAVVGLLIICITFALSPASFAQPVLPNQSGEPLCTMDLSVENSVDWRGALGRGYEVFGTEDSFETLSISIVKQGEACDFFLTAAPNSAGGENTLSGPNDKLTYDILKSTNGPSVLDPDYLGSALSRVSGRFGTGQASLSSVFYVSIPIGQFVRSGTYNGQALIRLFREGSNGPELLAERPIALVAPVASVLKVSSDTFYANAREASIDFGDLAQGARRAVNFDVVSNADITIGFHSLHNSRLAHSVGGPGIEYQLMFKGDFVDLRTQYASQRIVALSNGAPQPIPIEIVIPPPVGIPAAGSYNDLLTITFTAD